jgi:hypothetical protein
MQTTDVESIKTEFMMYWCGKVQDLTELRRSKMSQSEMAFISGRSLKTIQRFENYKVFDPELMFIYNSITLRSDKLN